ncbi:hypothetical protein [Streptomyces muensis]|uniref:Uncharacterized protein n=1 Tax=Streptomyces muensis TaxID=1077944 RepID=A0A9X1PZZ2_STRM4|nr:hypothetical protein [Streptomyces muensis]MCF1596582.1 hypothetical protein [Streptomyces muensis]
MSFDKAGTLTLGRPLVTSVVTVDETVTADEALSLAASGELTRGTLSPKRSSR